MKLFKVKGRKNFQFWYYDETRTQRWRSAGSSNRRQAELNAERIMKKMIQSWQDKADGVQEITLSQYCVKYLDVRKRELRPSTKRLVKSSFDAMIKSIGDLELRKIGHEEVMRFLNDSRVSLHRAITHYGHLRSAFKRAIRLRFLEDNVFLGVDKPAHSVHEEADWMTPEEFAHVCSAMPERSYYQRSRKRMMRLLFEVGARLGEVRFLDDSALNISDARNPYVKIKSTHLHATKSGKPRRVPLSSRAVAILMDQLLDRDLTLGRSHRPTQFVFAHPTSGREIPESTASKFFRDARRKVYPERQKLRLHGLRHSFCTNLLDRGALPQHVQQMAGHSDIRTTMGYSHLGESEMVSSRSIMEDLWKTNLPRLDLREKKGTAEENVK